MDNQNVGSVYDIGKAVTQVLIGPYWRRHEPIPYQEAWVSETVSSSSAVSGNMFKSYPADFFAKEVNSTGEKWEPIPELSAMALELNKKPGAPKHTFVYGRIAKNSDLPWIYIPEDDGYPSDGQYTTSIPSSSTPSLQQDVSDVESFSSKDELFGGTFFDDRDVQYQKSVNEEPFIPSDINKLSSEGASKYYDHIKNISKDGRIPTWNVWELKHPDNKDDGRRYVYGYGPDWSHQNYNGPQIRQDGDIDSSFSVRVIATHSSATVYRKYPIYKDVGRILPWVFPYTDENGAIKHDIIIGNNIDNNGSLNDYFMEMKNNDETPNIGFIVEMNISSETDRVSSTSSPGSTSHIEVKWGNKSDTGKPFERFSVSFSPKKGPFLSYYDGEKLVNIVLSESVIFGSTSLIVEYFGNNMLVAIDERKNGVLVKGIDDDPNNKMRGISIISETVEISCTNCCLNFTFTPSYYNPWDPQQFYTTDADNRTYDSQFAINKSWVNGLSKLFVGPVIINLNKGDDIDKEIEDILREHTYHLDHLVSGRDGENKNRINNDLGYPQMWLDSRHSKDGKKIPLKIMVGRKKSEQKTDDGSDSVFISCTPVVTHTTPVVFGMKMNADNTLRSVDAFADDSTDIQEDDSAHDDTIHRPIVIENKKMIDVTNYVKGWTIEWNGDEHDGMCKIMKSTASINFLNLPEKVLRGIQNNSLLVEIRESGYPDLHRVVDDGLKKYVYSKILFRGFIQKLSVEINTSGEKEVDASCVDMSIMLEQDIFRTNLKLDGRYQLTALTILFEASSYKDLFKMRNFHGKEINPVSLGWMNEDNPDIEEFKKYFTLAFGMEGDDGQPGESYEVYANDPIMPEIESIVKNFHDIRAFPLFFYDPSARNGEGAFIFTVRSHLKEPSLKITAPPFYDHKNDLTKSLPMISSVEGGSVYTEEYIMSNMLSEYHILGRNRHSQLFERATEKNRSAYILSDKDSDDWYKYSGHIGRRAIFVQNDRVGSYPDKKSLQKHAAERIKFLSNPDVMYSHVEVHGVITPMYEFGMVSARMADGTTNNKLAIINSTIMYKASDQSVTSRVNLYKLPAAYLQAK